MCFLKSNMNFIVVFTNKHQTTFNPTQLQIQEKVCQRMRRLSKQSLDSFLYIFTPSSNNTSGRETKSFPSQKTAWYTCAQFATMLMAVASMQYVRAANANTCLENVKRLIQWMHVAKSVIMNCTILSLLQMSGGVQNLKLKERSGNWDHKDVHYAGGDSVEMKQEWECEMSK